jgi:hypothetical protein
MAQIFHRSTNTISKLSLFGILLALGAILWLLAAFNRSDYYTEAHVVRAQPVPFSHKHHVGGLGLDCRYCHTSVEKSSFAGIPATAICMNCHSQIWSTSEMLQPVRDSYQNEKPLTWTRVHNLADFVYFDHSIHIAKGVGCATCHGRVDQMPLMWQEASLQMEWCLACHRDPAPNLRPKELIFSMEWQPPDDGGLLGKQLMQQYQIAGPQLLTSCSVCHR